MASVKIVGVLNVTPDSFHDGGKFTAVDAALRQAEKMLQDGADIIEIGGESTGPTSPEVSFDEELRRVLPVLQALRKRHPDAVLSVDTYKAEVARAALESGAAMINDVTAGCADAKMLSVLASSTARIVLMYAKDPTPRTTIQDVQYDDVVLTVKQFLRERRDAAVRCGIALERIILDPGLGHFVSSDARYSFQILARLREFLDLGCPLLLSPSRKSFLAGSQQLTTENRLPGTLAASAIAVANGATYIRTHDVREVRMACEVASLVTLSAPRLTGGQAR